VGSKVNIWIWLFCLTIVLGCTSRQQIIQKKSGYYLKLNDVIQNTDDQNYLVTEFNTQVRIFPNKTAKKYVSKEFVVFNESGRAETELVLYYDSFIKVSRIKGAIYSIKGVKIKDLDSEDISDFPISRSASSFGESRVKLVSLNHNTYPYIIEYQYEETSSNLLIKTNWSPRQNREMVYNAGLEVAFPEDVTVNIKDLTKGATRSESIRNGIVTTSWNIQNLRSNQADTDELNKVIIQPVNFKIEDSEGSFKTWESFGQWYYKLNEGRQELSPDTKSELDDLLEGITSNEEKAKIIYNYLQRNTRYISIQLGIGGWQTFPASFVENKGYGDCKALTNFAFSMFDYADIKAYPVLINNGIDAEHVVEDFPSQQFNHVVLFLPHKESNIWLECTSQILPFNYLTLSNSGRRGLLITEEGGELIDTPDYNEKVNYSIAWNRVTPIPGNETKISRSTTTDGFYMEDYLFGLYDKTKAQRANWLDRYYSLDLTKYSEINSSDIDNKERPVKVFFDVMVKDFFKESGKRMFIPVHQFKKEFHESTNDFFGYSKPLFSFSEVDSTYLVIPEGYSIEFLPSSLNREYNFGKYLLSVQKDTDETQDQLLIIREFQIKDNVINKEDVSNSELESFLNFVNSSDKQEVVLINND